MSESDWQDRALCTDPGHRVIWQAERDEHYRQVEAGTYEGRCQCHLKPEQKQPIGRPVKTNPDWTAYWWDITSPDPEYAKAVCRACPVKSECAENRVSGSSGIYAGQLITERMAQRERAENTRRIVEHNRALDRHDPRRIRLQSPVAVAARTDRRS